MPPPRSPWASASGSNWRWRCPAARHSCCSTSSPRGSRRRGARTSCASMHGFGRTASRSSPSSTRSRCSPRWPTGCSSSTAGHSSLTGRRPRSSIRPRSGQRTWARRSKGEVARLTVESLEVGYDGVQVLRGVALEARGGEFVAVVGPNGAGKSTLLKAVAGLLRPQAGTIRLDDERIDGRSPWEIAAGGVTLIPEGRRLFGPLSVRENLELGAFVPRGGAVREETLRVVYRLFPVLDGKQRMLAQHLSGGEQQMLALARGLMARSEERRVGKECRSRWSPY